MVGETGLRAGDVLTRRGLVGILRRGAWLAQSVEHATLDLGVVSLSPTSGVEIAQI